MRLESQAAVNINADLRLQSETFTAEEWSAINLGMNRKKKKKKKKDKKSKKVRIVGILWPPRRDAVSSTRYVARVAFGTGRGM